MDVKAYRTWPNAQSASSAETVNFDYGQFVIPSKYTAPAQAIIDSYVKGAYKTERSTLNNIDTSLVSIYRTTESVTADVRMFITTKPFVAVMNSGGKYTVINFYSSSNMQIQVDVLTDAGFIKNRHFRVMSYDEVLNTDAGSYYSPVRPELILISCVTILTEPHFESGTTLGPDFTASMRKFVNSGGNFLAQVCQSIM